MTIPITVLDEKYVIKTDNQIKAAIDYMIKAIVWYNDKYKFRREKLHPNKKRNG